MSNNNKVILRVKKDKNKWFYFGKGRFRLQLAGDPRRDGYWLDQYAKKAFGKDGSDEFFKDLTKVLSLMAEDNAEIFSLYEMPEVIKWSAEE